MASPISSPACAGLVGEATPKSTVDRRLGAAGGGGGGGRDVTAASMDAVPGTGGGGLLARLLVGEVGENAPGRGGD